MGARQFGFFASIMLASAAGALGQASPPNDSFANRTVITGSSLTFTGTLAGATLETGEPATSCSTSVSGGSVWWTWTASDSTPVTISIVRDYSSYNSFNTWLEVCSGTNLNALTEIDCNRFDGPPGRYVKFAATAGTPYQSVANRSWPVAR